MALNDYSDPDNETQMNFILERIGWAFTIIFVIECMIKVIGMGFIVHKHSYLRDPWNWIDFTAVVIGGIEFLPNLPNLKFIRTLRVIRPLRSIKALPSMRRLISSLLNSLPALANVVVFLLFVFILFGIFGIQTFQSNFYSVCRTQQYPDPETKYWPIDFSATRLCQSDADCPAGDFCGSSELYRLSLDQDTDIEKYELINYGITNFDNIAAATLTIFQVITLEGWTNLMYNLQDSGQDVVAPIYFCLLVVIGSFLLLQIVLAVIMNEFTKVDMKMKIEQERLAHQQAIQRQISKVFDENQIIASQEANQLSNVEAPQFTANDLQKKVRRKPSSLQQNLDNSLLNQSKTHIKQVIEAEISEDFEKRSFEVNSSVDSNYRGRSVSELPKIDSKNPSYVQDNSQIIKVSDYIKNKSPMRHQSTENGKQILKLNQKLGSTGKKKTRNAKKVTRVAYTDNRLESRIQFTEQSQITERITERNIFEPSFQPKISISQLNNKPESSLRDQGPEDLNTSKAKIGSDSSFSQQSQINNSVRSKLSNQENLDELIQRSRKNIIFRIFFLVCTHWIFVSFITMLIVVNTIILAMDRYPLDEEQFSVFEVINNVISSFFVAEMVIKIIGLGPKLYFLDKFNQFDCLIVMINILDLILNSAQASSSNSGAVSALRAIRLLRIFKLAKSWHSFQVMLIKIGRTLKDISNFTILLFLFIFTYAMLGMELYAYKVRFDESGEPINLDQYNGRGVGIGDSPRENFDTFLFAITTIFSWNEIMYKYVRAVGQPTIMFFVCLNILGKLILLNLFLAILLKNFEEHEIEQDKSKQDQKVINRIRSSISGVIKNLTAKIMPTSILGSQKSMKAQSSQEADTMNQNTVFQLNQQEAEQEMLPKSHISKLIQDLQKNSEYIEKVNEKQFPLSVQNSRRDLLASVKKDSNFDQNPQENQDDSHEGEHKESDPDKSKFSKEIASYVRKRRSVYVSEIGHSSKIYKLLQMQRQRWINPYTLHNKSFFVLSPENKFRDFCAKVLNFKLFEAFILFVISVSTVALALDNPLNDPKGKLANALSYLDIIFTSIFSFEFVIKIVTLGFIINGPKSYLRSGWNQIDLTILIFAVNLQILIFQWISLAQDGDGIDFKFIKVLRLLRVVRPLRLIQRNQGLKVAVESLINSISGIFNVFIVSSLFFLLFGIFGINYFKGTFYYCYTSHLPSLEPTDIIEKWQCINIGGEWINQDDNFDNILSAIKTLFGMSSTEGWTDIMWASVDSNAIDYQPIENNKPLWVLFYMAFMLFGSLFIMNLFVGVVINTFNEEKEKMGKNHLLTPFQKEWVLIQLAQMKVKPLVKMKRIYSSKFRNFVAEVANHFYFEIFILSCIILNTICLAIEWYNQPDDVNSILEIINYVFAFIFTVEFVLKVIALGFKIYFSNGWNCFDFLVVVGTIGSIFLSLFTTSSFGASATLIRSFRIGRVLRLIQKAGNLKKIFNTFILTMPSLANVGALLILLLYVFSILGVFLFSEVKLQENLDRHANFQNFFLAFLTLVRCSTGESWNYIMNDCARIKSILFDCVENPTYEDYIKNQQTIGCGDPISAILFFVVFTLLLSMIFLNLFIAIILESFDSANEQEDLKIKEEDMELFQKTWLPYDEDGTGFIKVKDIDSFICDLVTKNSNLVKEGQRILHDKIARRHFIEELEMPTYAKMTKFHYGDVLFSLCQASIQTDLQRGQYYQHSEVQLTSTQSEKDQFNQKSSNIVIEDEMEKIEKINKQQKIALVEQYNKLKNAINTQKLKQMDRFEGHFYNSRFIYLIPRMKIKMRIWLTIKKEKRRIQNESSMMQQKLQQEIKDSLCSIEKSEELDSLKIVDEDEEALEIINKSANQDDFKQKGKYKTTKEIRRDGFAKSKMNKQLSTIDTDINSLIKQLTGNQESLSNSNKNSDGDNNDQQQDTDRFLNTNRILVDKDWAKKKGPNRINTIISELPHEQSSVSSSRNHKKNSSGCQSIRSKHQKNESSQNVTAFNNSLMTNKRGKLSSRQLSENLQYLQQTDSLNNADLRRTTSAKKEKKSNLDQNLLLLSDTLKEKQNQKLDVSFGLSENQFDDHSHQKGIFRITPKLTEVSLQKFVEESHSKQEDKDEQGSPRFISFYNNPKLSQQFYETGQALRMQSIISDANQLSSGKIYANASIQSVTSATKQKLSEKKEQFQSTISNLIRFDQIRKNQGSNQQPDYQNQTEDVLVIGTLYTDQSEEEKSSKKYDNLSQNDYSYISSKKM